MNSFSRIQISEQIYNDFFDKFSKFDFEMYGILGSSKRNSITKWNFVMDENIFKSHVTIRKETMEYIVNELWLSQGIQFVGLIHSHIRSQAYLSDKDIRVAYEILRMNPELPYIYMLVFYRDELDALYGYKLYLEKSKKYSEIQFSELIFEKIY